MKSASLPNAPDTVLSVSEFTAQVKCALQSQIPQCWVRGEISNLRRQSSGHVYFTLKDEKSQLSAVLFRGNASRQTVQLKEGQQVTAFGEIGVYEPRGTYQLIVRLILDDGVGRLQQEFERLKQQLKKEGLFASDKKRPIPDVPKRIGIITSPTGAALQDFISVLKRRAWGGELIVFPALVQGEAAASEMISQVARAQQVEGLDLLVIGRGGGSLEDLWPFNNEALVRALAACAIPVISAVGHEIDFTLCDFVCDLRAETPTAAAELISSHRLQYLERMRAAAYGFEKAAQSTWRTCAHSFELLAARLDALSPRYRLENAYLRLDDIAERLDKIPQNYLESQEKRLSHLEQRLKPMRLEDTLARGFVIVRDSEGRPITRKAALEGQEQLVNQFSDGSVKVRLV
tara:strand:+ start:26093 stop:27301 length:1209 start_codon:yes stop_codon:yes gene_type:complete